MFIGCVFGTYSSIFVAAPIVVDLIAKKQKGEESAPVAVSAKKK